MKDLKEFTNLTSEVKTLRFGLNPVGKTLENIHKEKILEQDQELKENSQKIKESSDEYYKYIIQTSLEELKDEEKLSFKENLDAYELARENDDDTKIAKIEANLRTIIAKSIKKNSEISGKKYFEELEDFCNKKSLFFKDIKGYVTYFTNYFDTRKNLFSADEKASSVAYRLINENLPTHYANIKLIDAYKKDKAFYAELCKEVAKLTSIPELHDLDKVFSVDFYDKLLNQDSITCYNTLIGGYTTEKTKIRGINEIINNYNNTNKTSYNYLSNLYKLPLFDVGTMSSRLAVIEDNQTVIDTIEEINNIIEANKDDIHSLFTDMSVNKEYFIKKDNITEASLLMFGKFDVLTKAAEHYYKAKVDTSFNSKMAKANEKKAESLIKEMKKFTEKKLTSLRELQTYIDFYAELETNEKYKDISIMDSIVKPITHFTLILPIEDAYDKIESLVKNVPDKFKKDDIANIKEFLDNSNELLRFLKLFAIGKDNGAMEKDDDFYFSLNNMIDKLTIINISYNKIRNYLTKKPKDEKKLKLNFDNSLLLSGWSNPEVSSSFLLTKGENEYYLGILKKSAEAKKLYRAIPEAIDDKDKIEIIDYKQFPTPNKNLPRVFIASKNANPPSEIKELYERRDFIKSSENFNKDDLCTLIRFFMDSLDKHPVYKNYHLFNGEKPEQFEDLSEFYNLVEERGYCTEKIPVSESYIHDMVEQGELFLFRIWSQDFSQHAHGKKDLNTLYFKEIFNDENQTYKLLGGAEIFFRDIVIPKNERIIHKADEPIYLKSKKDEKRIFNYDIIKDKRYTQQKFFLHVTVQGNYKCKQYVSMNDKFYKYAKDNDDLNILAINRGERNLIVVVITDRHGNILKDENGNSLQLSFNTISNTYYSHNTGKEETVSTDYATLLDNREKERQLDRQSWNSLDNIKELKKAYTAQLVSKITKLAIKYNAAIVIEDLNSEFKQSRKRIEKAIYTTFEQALINKLHYLIFKDITDYSQPGSVANPLQLCAPITTVSELFGTNGFVSFLNAWGISGMDPTTGFINQMYHKYSTRVGARNFLQSFIDISYNKDNDYFEFTYDLKDFKKIDDLKVTKWTVCTHGIRHIYEKKQTSKSGKYEVYNATKELKEALSKAKINYEDGNLIESICLLNDSALYKAVIDAFMVISQVRYYDNDSSYILSPVKKDGKFFDSREAEASNNTELPHNLDFSSALLLARKGALQLERLNESFELADWYKIRKATKYEWINYYQDTFC